VGPLLPPFSSSPTPAHTSPSLEGTIGPHRCLPYIGPAEVVRLFPSICLVRLSFPCWLTSPFSAFFVSRGGVSFVLLVLPPSFCGPPVSWLFFSSPKLSHYYLSYLCFVLIIELGLARTPSLQSLFPPTFEATSNSPPAVMTPPPAESESR